MAPALKRSNINFAWRVFLDRLATDNGGATLAAPDLGPGNEYEYGEQYDPYNLGKGADCSGSAGIFIGAAVNGPAGMKWARLFSTETFPGPFAGLFRQVSQAEFLKSTAPIKVAIGHHGGGEDSHMHISIDGIVMESNGSSGTCTAGHGAMTDTDPYWNDWWVYDGGIEEDTTRRQPMGYPRGLDYAGGRISGATLKANGIAFVCRYLTDGGSGLPGKQLLPDEFADLVANGIAVVFNFETTADRMLDGYDAGVADAQYSLNYIRSLPGGPQNPVVYFSCDFDEAPNQDQAVEDYLRGAASVLGGMDKVGIYGAFYICTRAQAAVGVKYIWQTEAWSGGNITSAVNIMQRNGLGFATVGGVQCDVNEAHTDDFGQFVPGAPVVDQPAPPADAPNAPAIPKPADDLALDGQVWDQMLLRWDMLGKRTPVEVWAAIGEKLGVPGCFDPLRS